MFLSAFKLNNFDYKSNLMNCCNSTIDVEMPSGVNYRDQNCYSTPKYNQSVQFNAANLQPIINVAAFRPSYKLLSAYKLG